MMVEGEGTVVSPCFKPESRHLWQKRAAFPSKCHKRGFRTQLAFCLYVKEQQLNLTR